MKKYLKKLPRELKKVVNQIIKVSRQTRLPAYLVGGCLRDLILGVKNLDLDIAVEGSGIIFAQKLSRKLKSTLKIYPQFQTATLILSNGLKVDFATTRKEKYPFAAALPVVSSGPLLEDLQRRDFTINALALRLAPGKEQEIIDPCAGQADLALGKIRILHVLSFKDDPTRILRALRFSWRFGFKIEPKTLALLKEAIRDGALARVSPHRMREELILMLKEPRPFRPLKQLGDLGGLSFISNKLKIGKFTRDLFAAISKEAAWFVKSFPARRKLDAWLVYFMGLLELLTLRKIKMIMDKLGLPKADQRRVIDYYPARRKLVVALSKKRLAPERVYALLRPLSSETIVFLSGLARNKNFKKHLMDFFNTYQSMRLDVSGDDLIKLGVLPGPAYQKILAKVLAAKLNGQVNNRSSELALIKNLVSRK